VVTELVERLPEVDILLNNLGIYEPKPFEEIPDAGEKFLTLARGCPVTSQSQ